MVVTAGLIRVALVKDVYQVSLNLVGQGISLDQIKETLQPLLGHSVEVYLDEKEIERLSNDGKAFEHTIIPHRV